MKVEAPEIKVTITVLAMDKIIHWCDMARGEISGLGLVEEVKNGFLVNEVFLPFQACGGADTVIEPEAVARLMMEVEKLGHDPAMLKFWWHSHADMRVFWSGTDVDTISKFKPQDFFVSMVVNRRGEKLARVDYYKPFRVSFLDVPTQLLMPELHQKESCEALFKERVRERNGLSHLGGFGQEGHGGSPLESSRSDYFDLTLFSPEEIISRIATGELNQEEAEELLAERDFQLKEKFDGWD